MHYKRKRRNGHKSYWLVELGECLSQKNLNNKLDKCYNHKSFQGRLLAESPSNCVQSITWPMTIYIACGTLWLLRFEMSFRDSKVVHFERKFPRDVLRHLRWEQIVSHRPARKPKENQKPDTLLKIAKINHVSKSWYMQMSVVSSSILFELQF